MERRSLFSLKGVNIWFLASAVALNVFWALGTALLVSILFLQEMGENEMFVQLYLIASAFFGPFLIGWGIGNWAADRRALTYGVYGSFGSVLVLAFTALPSGLLGLMLIIVALAGGFNGGMLSLRRRMQK